VNTTQGESDHVPLEADFSVPVPQTVHHPACVGVPIRRRHWNVECHASYSQALQSPACAQSSQDVQGAPTGNNIDAAVQAICGAVQMAVDVGGMPAKRSDNTSAQLGPTNTSKKGATLSARFDV
jgi:hypothetical protein